MFTFMWTCDTRACYVTSWVGWGGGDVHVHVNLRHTRMLRHVLGWVGWGDVHVHVNLRHTRMLRHVLGWVGWGGCSRSCELATHAHATSRLGLGGVGGCSRSCELATHAHATSRLLGLGGVGGMFTFMWTCDTRACYVTSWVGWGGGGCSRSCVPLQGNLLHQEKDLKKRILIHTGGVDAMWRLSKSAIPCSLATMVNGHVNPKLMRSIRIWQWRWQSSKENVMEKTGRMLQKRMESWKRKKQIRHVFSTKIFVNYRQTC